MNLYRLSLRVVCVTIACQTIFAAAPTGPVTPGQAEHVVVVVWDGMRPDFVTQQYCPTLYALATNGVFFRRNHCAYISSTEVNGTALATGANPGRNGILANTEYQPEMSVLSSFATEGLDSVLRGDLLSGGHYIMTPTVAEILQDAGFPTIIAGSKPVVLLHNRSAKKVSKAEKDSVTLFEGKTLPRAVAETLIKVNEDKPFPTNVTYPNTAQDLWTTQSLLGGLWKKGVPRYTLLWLSDPDKSQHETGVGSPTALAGIESSDQNLLKLIKTLKEKGAWDKTDLMVVSDHGFSTITRGPDVAAILKKQGFPALSKLENPEPGDVMVVGLGGSVLLYVVEHDERVIRALVEFLQTTDFAGVIFSRLPIEGTFHFESVGYRTTNDPPDLIVSLRWSGDRNQYGAPGLMQSMGGTPNKGSHASLSPFDMNNTLVASGPHFKRGFISDTPSGNIDVAPTVLHLLGVKSSQPMDGRVLHEALASANEQPTKANEQRIEAKRELGLFRWKQYLKFSEVNGTVYFDEGNGEVIPK